MHRRSRKKLLEEAYHKLKEILVKEQEIAKKNTKPLLLLLGGHHYHPYSQLIEIMILYIAYSHLSVRNTHVELDASRYEIHNPWAKIEEMTKEMNGKFYLLDCLKNEDVFKETDYYGRFLNVLEVINKYLLGNIFYSKILMMKLRHTMRPLSAPDIFSASSLKERNSFMAQKITQINQDSLAIVGLGHLQGLMNETNLKKHFHVVAFNCFPEAQRFSLRDLLDFNEYLLRSLQFSLNPAIHFCETFLSSTNDLFSTERKIKDNLDLLKEINDDELSAPVPHGDSAPKVLVHFDMVKTKELEANEKIALISHPTVSPKKLEPYNVQGF